MVQWKSKFHDDLGDVFDVVSVGPEINMNRHDLAKVSYSAEFGSFLADASEMLLTMRTLKPGRLVLQF